MFNIKRKVAFLAVPALAAMGAVSYASVVAFAAPTHGTGVVKTAAGTEPAESTTEATTSADPVGPNEPAGGGYADPAGAQADTQQEGNN